MTAENDIDSFSQDISASISMEKHNKRLDKYNLKKENKQEDD